MQGWARFSTFSPDYGCIVLAMNFLIVFAEIVYSATTDKFHTPLDEILTTRLTDCTTMYSRLPMVSLLIFQIRSDTPGIYLGGSDMSRTPLVVKNVE